MRSKLIFLVAVILFTSSCNQQDSIKNRLWYKAPAENWFSALPLGNGRLGAMVYGTVEEERIQMNEESLWAGKPENPYPDNVTEHYKKFQELNLEGKYAEALEYGLENLAASPTSMRSYETLGELFIRLGHSNPEIYKRQLDLETGISTVEYEIDGTKYTRESFISEKYNAMFFHFEAAGDDQLDASIRYEREEDIEQYINENNVLCIDGQVFDDEDGYDANIGGSGEGGYHMKFNARVALLPGSLEVTGEEEQLKIKDAKSFTVVVSAATDYNPALLNFDRNIDPENTVNEIMSNALEASYKEIRNDHVQRHSEAFNSLEFSIADIEADVIPTDVRINNLKVNENATDKYLTQLFFQYGRYLLMNSSAGKASLPASLQGLWNKDMWAAWESDYHLNINLQMNYWPADVCNIPGAFDPLSDFMYRHAEKGQETAQKFIGSDGWVAHHCTTIFGRTTPSGSNISSQVNNGYCFPLAGAWMSLSLWRHYEFTQDKAYLEKTVYPVISGAAEFILDFLVENEKGELVTAPSYSPENSYINPETGEPIRNTVAATMDIQIINELFKACLDAEQILGKSDYTKPIKEALLKLPKVRIGADGTIQEWYEDYEEAHPGHRHISHLFGLHPGTQINPSTPELFEAARKTIEKRLSYGGGQTGWSRAWTINFYARFFDGNECNEHINALLRTLVSPNLFDLHPPHIFQIDGNLGATAGIAEMLIQSHEQNTIRLLPALPDTWKDGHVYGIKARGAYVVDMDWEDGVLQKVKITAEKGGSPKVIYGDKEVAVDIPEGKEVKIDFSKI